jgi:chemotaxis signal transduction protein
VAPPSALIGDPSTGYVRGLGRCEDRLVILLDISKALGFEAVA